VDKLIDGAWLTVDVETHSFVQSSDAQHEVRVVVHCVRSINQSINLLTEMTSAWFTRWNL